MRLDVGDADEVLGELAARVEHRHEFLIGFHRLDQRFLRDPQKLLVELACDRDRPFGEIRDLIEQRIAQARPADARADTFHLLAHTRAARLRVDDDLRREQRIDVCIGRVDADRLRMHETMTARFAPAGDAEERCIDHRLAMQQHQPVHRAYECEIVIAPAHRFRDRQILECFADQSGNQFGGRLTGLLAARYKTFAFGIAAAFELLDGNAVLRGEAAQRRRRITLRIKADVQVRPECFRSA